MNNGDVAQTLARKRHGLDQEGRKDSNPVTPIGRFNNCNENSIK